MKQELREYIVGRLGAGEAMGLVIRRCKQAGWEMEHIFEVLESMVYRPEVMVIEAKAESGRVSVWPKAAMVLAGLVLILSGAMLGWSGVLKQPDSRAQEGVEIDTGWSPNTEEALKPPAEEGLIRLVASESGEVAGVSEAAESGEKRSTPGEPTNVNPGENSQAEKDVIKTASRDEYKIAVFGDSMVDTMETDLPYLRAVLEEQYPEVTFELYNYGVGAEPVETGLTRFNQPLKYKDRDYPSLAAWRPDIIILGSFAYNPFSPHDAERYRENMEALIGQAKRVTPNVYLLAEVAPLGGSFGVGKNGVDWPEETRWEQATKIKELLWTLERVAIVEDLPLVNVFEATRDESGFGAWEYTNADDGIHASVKGHDLTAKMMVEKMELEFEVN